MLAFGVGSGLLGAYVIAPRVAKAMQRKNGSSGTRSDLGALVPPRPAEVVVYGAPWCSACKMLEADLRAAQIPHTFRNIEQDPEADRFVEEASERGAIPVVTINGQVIVGYRRDAIESALGKSLPRPGPEPEPEPEPRPIPDEVLVPEGWLFADSTGDLHIAAQHMQDKAYVIAAVDDVDGGAYLGLLPMFAQLATFYPDVAFLVEDRVAIAAEQGQPLEPKDVVMVGAAADEADLSICTVFAPGGKGSELLGLGPDTLCEDMDPKDDVAAWKRLVESIEAARVAAADTQVTGAEQDAGAPANAP